MPIQARRLFSEGFDHGRVFSQRSRYAAGVSEIILVVVQ